MKYNFDKPLPNQQRTLAKDNTAALAAQSWVIRFNPTKDRNLPAVSRSFEEGRVYAYVAQYTKEMAEAAPIIAQLEAGYTPAATKLPDAAQPDAKRFKAA